MDTILPHPERAAAGALIFPIKLRCAALSDLTLEAGLEPALTRALGRAFARARAVLPASVAFGGGVMLHKPALVPGQATTGEQSARLLQRVWRAIESAALAQVLPRATAPAPRVASRQSPGEAFDAQRYDPDTGTYELASYRGGTTRPPVLRHTDPLAKLRDLYEQVIAALNVLLDDQARSRFPTQGRSQARIGLANERDEMAHEHNRIGYLADKPKLTRMREQSLRSMLTLLTIIRPRVADLDREASGIAAGRALDRTIATALGHDDGVIDKDFLQAALVELGDIYLALARPTAAVHAVVSFDPAHPPVGKALLDVHEKWFGQYDLALRDAFDRMAFLDDYYRDPKVLAGIAMMRFAASQIEMIWAKLADVRPKGPTTPPAWPSLNEEHKALEFYLPSASARTAGSAMTYQLLQIAITMQNAERVYSVVKQVTGLPKSTREVGPAQSQAMTAWVSAKVWHLQVEIAILGLWQNLPVVRAILEQYRTVDRGSDGARWMLEVDALTGEFQQELNPARFPNKDIQEKVDGWQTRVQKLFDEVTAAIKHEQMVKMIGWMVVGLVLSFGVSFWLQAALQGSKLLLFVAEGVALTGINVGIAAAQGQPITLKGVAGELVLNVSLQGFGRLISLFRGGGEIAEQISRSRRLLTGLAEGTAMVTATTLGQAGLAALLDDQAKKAGGETSTTQMLSVNFIFNTIGFLLGASLHKFMTPTSLGAPTVDAEALTVRLKTELDITIDRKGAARLIDLARMTARFQADTHELAAAAKRGPLTEDQYLIWQGKGELLAIELEDVPELARILNKTVDPAEFKAMLAQLRAVLRAPFRSGIVLALPEFAGLAQVGDSVTWTYDPAQKGQEKAREAVRARFDHPPASRVRTLSGDGWEAIDPQGRTLIQVLPASPEVAGLLSPPLRAIVETASGRNGADLIEGQSAVPGLGTLLKEAGHGANRAAVRQILEAVGAPGGAGLTTGDDAAWRGLAEYLRQGGDPVRLADVLKLRRGKTSPEATGDHVRRVLTQLGDSDPATLPKTRRLLAFTGEATQAGLAKVQEQPHVPGLEAMLENAAATAPGDVKILLPSLRFLDINDGEVWTGLANYLQHDGNLAIVNRALGYRGPEGGPNRVARIRLAFKTMAHWDARAIRALAANEQVHPSALRSGRHYASLFFTVPETPADTAAAPASGQAPQAQAAQPTGLTRQQSDFLDRLLQDHEDRGIPAPDLEAIQKELAQRDEAGRWRLLRSWRASLHARVAHAEATRSGDFFPAEEDGTFDPGQELHRIENQGMTTREGAERVGALRGRDFAENKLKLRDAGWINPFEGRRSRFGTGFDDVMIDKNGVYWIVEYKGGSAELEGDQMQNSWVLRKLRQYREHGGELGVYWAEELENALANKRLRGVLLQTKIVGRTAQPTEVVQTWPAYHE